MLGQQSVFLCILGKNKAAPRTMLHPNSTGLWAPLDQRHISNCSIRTPKINYRRFGRTLQRAGLKCLHPPRVADQSSFKEYQLLDLNRIPQFHNSRAQGALVEMFPRSAKVI